MRARLLPVAALATLVVAGPAVGGVHIGAVDTGGYPEVRVHVIVPPGSSRPFLEENGRPVTGATAVNLGREKSVVLAVDRSQSMRGAALADAADAARAFVAAKGAADRIEVIAFGRQALTLTRFSSSTIDAGNALRSLGTDARSGTALWDAIVLAAHGLEQQDQPGHVILVVTDGTDISSVATLADAIEAAHRAHASVYTIGIAGPDFSPGPLRELAAQTGGSYHQASSTSQLATLYSSIGSVLARTWEISYPTAARPGELIHLAAAVRGAGTGSRTVEIASRGLAAVPAAPPSLLPRSAWTSRLAPLAVALAVGLLILVACASFAAARNGIWLTARLAPHLGPSERRGPRRTKRARSNGGSLRGVFTTTEQVFANVKQFRALQRLLTQADLPLLAAELLYICLGAGVLLGLFVGVSGMPALLVVCFMAVGAALPVLAVLFKANARIKAFDNQLPDLLITIAASLKAGHSFRHAIQAVVDEGAEPAAKEFKRVLTETQLGRPMDAALADMGERIGSKNLAFVLTAVTIQRQIGGSLAGLFDMVAETVRQRQQFARKIRGLTAMGRMSAYVLAGLPFFIALTVTLMNPAYMAPLWGTPTGHELIGIGLAMLGVGGVILKKIVSFKG